MDVLCSLLKAPQGSGGSWLWNWDVGEKGGLCCASGSTSPAVVRHTKHRDFFSYSVLSPLTHTYRHRHTALWLRPPSLFSRSVHAFLSLLSSACRHTLTCCMSPCGNPACHLSIYLKKAVQFFIAEPGIYKCIFIGCRVILGTRKSPLLRQVLELNRQY